MSDLPAEIFPERVELEILESDPPVTAMCAMASFSDRGITLITADDAVVASFPAGTKVHGSYGDHSGFCQFDSEVGESSAGAAKGDPGIIRVLPPTQIITTQRRRYVRSAVEVEIACALLDSKAMAFRSAPGEVRNLGGGGLMMIIAAHPSLTKGSELALAIPAPGGGPVLALARTVEAVPTPDGPLQLRLAFTSIDPIGRERIERFVYRRTGGNAPAKLWATGKITMIKE
jgi:hypothetical protein